MLQILLACTLTPALDEISAHHDPISEFVQYRIDVEQDHWHFERDGRMLEYASLDVHSPIVTGAQIPGSLPEFVIVGSAMPDCREAREWWAASPAERRMASARFARYRESRAAARFKQLEQTRHDLLRFTGKHRMRC